MKPENYNGIGLMAVTTADNSAIDSSASKKTHGHSEVDVILYNGERFTVAVSETIESISALKNSWLELQNSSMGFDYFQSFDWCEAWVKTHCASAHSIYKPRVYCLRQKGRVVCILPLMAETHNGFKVLKMISEPLGQYSNLLANSELFSPELGEQLLMHVQRNEDADAILFAQYPENSLLDRTLGDRGFQEKAEMESSLAVLDDYDNWGDFQEQCLSSKIRKERRRRLKKLNAQGNLEYNVYLGGTEEYKTLITEALGMKAEWLRETGRRSDQLLSKETENFLTMLKCSEAIHNQPPQGAVAHVLTIDGKPVAIELGMSLDRHYYCYLGAFDYSWRKFSVGKIQMEMAQQWALKNGVSKFDFLGDPSDYKVNWTQDKHELKSRFIPLTAKGFLYVVVWRAYLRPILKSTYAAMGNDWRKKFAFFIGIAERMRSGKTASVPTERA